MREILFRGKGKCSGEWVEGDLSYCVHDGEVYIFPRNGYDSPDRYEIDSETVCQYTGLTDKHGRKIFEGDILSGVRYDDWGQGGEYLPDKCVIKWDEKHAAFAPVYWWDGYNYDLMNYEVIGNIFDNPDMIKGK